MKTPPSFDFVFSRGKDAWEKRPCLEGWLDFVLYAVFGSTNLAT
jgi:hypothetical protein